jgi:hypothetical protein
MPATKLTSDALLAGALAVRRGEKRVADFPEDQQAEVRKFIRKTPENKIRAAALADYEEHRTHRAAPQRRFARTRGY